MALQAHATLFAGSIGANQNRMAEVLRLSAMEHGLPLTIHEITDQDSDVKQLARSGCKQTWIDNARKAKHHNRIIQEAKDGDLLCMLDADTMITGDLSEVESMEFDLAYTVRPPGAKWKLNTGVYFVRVSPNMKSTVDMWKWMTHRLLEFGSDHDYWRKDRGYGGTHQAALGCLIEQGNYLHQKLVPLPCKIWNCVPSVVSTAPNPKVVHIMGQMRRWCLNGGKPNSEKARRLVKVWRQFDSKALCPTN